MAPEFRPEEILRTLDRHGVRHVLIGGLAATIHGSAHVTTDVDITPEPGRKNLERLSAALKELHAKIRVAGEPGGLPIDHDAASLARVGVLNMTTEFGDLDICATPAGTGGYKDLSRDAIELEILGVRTMVASLADVVRSKEAAGRPKDQLTLPTLRRLLDETFRS